MNGMGLKLGLKSNRNAVFISGAGIACNRRTKRDA